MDCVAVLLLKLTLTREYIDIPIIDSTRISVHILLRKNHLFSRARDTRARSLGFALFCFHNLHTRTLKRGTLQQEKKGESYFHGAACLQTSANSQKRGMKSVKTSDIFGKNSEKKR